MRALLFTITLSIVTSTHAAEIYRWVDENGKVHFTDKKPGQEKQAEEVKPNISRPQEPDEGEIRRREYLKSADLIQAEKEAEERLARPERDRKLADNVSSRKRAERCEQARINYGVTFEEMAIYWTEWGSIRPMWVNDYYQGEREYIEDRERNGIRDEITQELYQYCDEPNNDEALWATYDEWIDSEYCRVEQIALEKALDPKSRTPDGEIERMQNRVHEYCY